MSQNLINILVIDDDAQDRMLISRRLSRSNANVCIVEADKLEDGFDKLQSHPIDIALLDLTLTETEGLETLQQFKLSSPDVPVVVLTGMIDDSVAMEAIEFGAQDFIRKGEIDNPWLYRCILNAMQRHELQQELKTQSLLDSLTRLPNRTYFEGLLQSSFRICTRMPSETFTVVFIDLDEFKLINDCFGHEKGDQVLVEFSRRLKSCIRKFDTVARFGGDEFVVLLNNTKSDNDIEGFVNRLNSALDVPITIDESVTFMAASVGYVSYCAHYADVKHMLRDADTAMYEAKKAGKSSHRRFSPSMRENAVNTVGLDTQLRQALSNNEFDVHYQPIVSLETGQALKFEALIRWKHPTQGMISPLTFIPHAERTGLIVPLGQWVLRTVCEQVKKWDVEFPGNSIQACVNLSPKQVQAPEFVESVLETLRETGVNGNRITLEITETTIMENPEESVDMLQILREIGIQISIDDFGTGYSSLSKLHRFSFDSLKIDRSFVKELLSEGYAEVLVKTILLLADSIGLEVIAEGIETPEVRARLYDMGCTTGQGYLFGKPMPAIEASRLFENVLVT